MKIDHHNVDPVWVGTEEGLRQHLRNLALIEAKSLQAKVGRDDDDDDEDFLRDGKPYLLTTLGSTAIVTIHGSLKTSASWYDPYFNIASYPAIRHALYEANKDPAIERIILDINSPGGQATGVDETAKLISEINKVKPVVAVATGEMCSGGYWLGCSGSKVFASSLSVVGSIGAVMTHVDRTAEMEREGIKVSFIRSGDYKMIGTPYEKLDDKAREVMQTMVTTINNLFVQHVASSRGRSAEYVEQVPGQGRVFMGQASIDVGLVDQIATMNDVLTRAVAGEFDKNVNAQQNSYQFGITTGTIDMNKDQQAAIAAAMAAQGLSVQGSVTQEGEPTQPNTEVTTQADVTQEPAQVETQPHVDQPQDSAISILTNQLDAKTTALAQAQAQIQALQAQVQAAQGVQKGLCSVVASAVANMNVALGISVAASDYESTDPDSLLKEHARVSGSFVNKFKAGGVAATAATQEAGADVRNTTFNRAAIAATKLA